MVLGPALTLLTCHPGAPILSSAQLPQYTVVQPKPQTQPNHKLVPEEGTLKRDA